jgi:spore germination protein
MDIYVVQPGDTIDSIAEKYGVTPEKLIQDNEIDPDRLVPGQSIVIVYSAQTYTVQEGDTLSSIASDSGITVMQLIRNNPFLLDREFIFPGETLVISYNTNGKIVTNGFSYPFISRAILRKTLPYLTYLTVINYTAAGNGELLSNFDDSEIIKMTKEYNVVPLMMITTLTTQGAPNLEAAFSVLLKEEYQDRLIDDMLNVLKTKGYHGINIVFNYMNAANQGLYQSFLTKISDRLGKEGYIVFVTINPNIKNTDTEISYEKIDYSIISPLVNGIIFLQFIWGINSEPPAPISSIANLRALVDYVVSLMSPDKVIIGKPIVGYDWELPYLPGKTTAHALTVNSALSMAYDAGAKIQFDEISQTPYFRYIQFSFGTPIEHIVWFIDARSINALFLLISEYGLNGTGIWNIMVYVPQLWLIINSQYEIVKILPEY